ncbi:hypothetical protein [Allochromatium warmingii]|uniref:hypothetical protein n=1 Tax=Allochromatium warmingii TaxID=61595 RepID=UPI0015A544C1|nr:hypothetical protein [Allochromatium warmingii]
MFKLRSAAMPAAAPNSRRPSGDHTSVWPRRMQQPNIPEMKCNVSENADATNQ